MIGPVLERTFPWRMVSAEWKRSAGEHFARVQPLLKAEDVLASTWRLPGREFGSDVAHLDDDRHVVTDEAFDEPVLVPRHELIIYSLDFKAFMNQVVQALDFHGATTPMPGHRFQLWALGDWKAATGKRVPVFAGFPESAKSLFDMICEIVNLQPTRFLVLLPSLKHRSLEVQRVLSRSQSHLLGFDDCMGWSVRGDLKATTPLREQLPELAGRKSPSQRQRPALAPTGSTWDDIRICEGEGETVVVFIRGASEEHTPQDLGLYDSRKEIGNEQWQLLIDLVRSDGIVELPQCKMRVAFDKRVRRLSLALSKAMGIKKPAVSVIRGEAKAWFRTGKRGQMDKRSVNRKKTPTA